MSDHSTRHLVQARFSLALIRWLAIISPVLLPFSLSAGLANWKYLAVAPVAGLLWIAVVVHSWRHDSPLAGAIAFLFVMGAHHLGNSFYQDEPPFGHFMQWLVSFLMVAGIPVVFFRSRVFRFCRMQEPSAQQAEVA